jgi:hypothetical protein
VEITGAGHAGPWVSGEAVLLTRMRRLRCQHDDAGVHSVQLPCHSLHWILDAARTPRTPLPQGFCTSCSLYLECFSLKWLSSSHLL